VSPSLFALLCLLGQAGAPSPGPGPSEQGRTRVIVPGPEYATGSLGRLVLGSGYRELWTTPIEAEVLDLGTWSGGLVARKKGGGKQTLSLRLEGADGREWKFRSLDKDPAPVLPESLRNTWVKTLVQDQISAAFPGSCLVVDVLSEAASILHAGCRIVVLPDDPRLGEFRREFALRTGTLEERPRTSPPVTPGFEPYARIADTDEMQKAVDADSDERVDSRAYLRARLFDALIGDYDRHERQWDWALQKDGGRWVPLPHDRDQAFVHFDGLAMHVVRREAARLVKFGADYPSVMALTYSARFTDRRFLAELDWKDWEGVLQDLVGRLTDAAIDGAVRALPPSFYPLAGARLAARLKGRRDRLPAFAREFYELLSREVEVHGTAATDRAQLLHRGDGSVEVVLAGQGGPYFRRTFRAPETKEVRLFLKGGDDHVLSEGRARPAVTVRVDGGDGDDTLDDSSGGYTRLYDSSGDNTVITGPGTRFNDRPEAPHLDRFDEPERDWGTSVGARPSLRVDEYYGVLLSASVWRERFGYRRYPYADRHSLRLDYGTSLGKAGALYEYQSRREDDRGRFDVVALATALDLFPYYGPGNEAVNTGPESFYALKQMQYVLAPSYRLDIRPVDVWVGPVVKLSDTATPASLLIGQQRPYGTGRFGQAGVRLQLALDRGYREAKGAAGLAFTVGGSFYPAVWSVREPFGEAHAVATAFLRARLPLEPTLVLRAGGQQLIGLYPFREAAFVGGVETLRGLIERRYTGDASAYGNAELRLLLRRRDDAFVPRLGVFGLADVGRVFLEGEESRRWHRAVGGGAWLAVVDPAYTASIALVHSEGDWRLYLQGGFMF
jgi:hypothetical protein